MANEIKYDALTGQSGLSLYAVIQNSDGASPDAGKFWNGSAWETKAAANWAGFAIALSESSGNYQYVGTMPATGPLAAAALVTIHIHERAGATAAICDPRLASQEFLWTGSRLLGTAKAMEAILAVVAGSMTFTESTGVTEFRKTDNTSPSVTYAVSTASVGRGEATIH